MSFELSFALLILRLGLAVTFFLHGSQHFLAWYGGRGFKSTVTNWKEKQQIPSAIGVIGVFAEFFGSIALFFGLLTRPAALGLVIFMAVAIWKSHWAHGFFLARREGEGNGFEYCMALMLMSLALLFGGSGAISLDWLLS
jgi:putative oxidoreductase